MVAMTTTATTSKKVGIGRLLHMFCEIDLGNWAFVFLMRSILDDPYPTLTYVPLDLCWTHFHESSKDSMAGTTEITSTTTQEKDERNS